VGADPCAATGARRVETRTAPERPPTRPTGLPSPQSRYLFALCCLQLGKLTEAEAALMPDNDTSKVPRAARRRARSAPPHPPPRVG
jgi:hypothetical protein